MEKDKLIRITTIPNSLRGLLRGQLKFMNSYFEVVGISSEGEALQEVKRNEGVRVIPIKMTRTISPLNDLKAVWSLYSILRKEKPLIVHSHTPKAGTVGMFAARLAGVPHRLHTIAGLPLLEATGKKRMLLDFVEKLTYACATKIYPNSFGLKDIILKNKYCSSKKIEVIGNGSSNGIDTNLFNPEIYSALDRQKLRDSLGISPEDYIFIFVGRLVGDKGVNELVAAFKELGEDKKRIKLVLVGSHEAELDPLQNDTLKEIEHNENIISTGYQKDVRPYFAIANALVFPSYREGFPNVVMQAGAMGLPCIVSDINGCNEIVVEGHNGLIVPVKNSEAIGKAMHKLVTDQVLSLKLKQNARIRITASYEQKLVWEAILEEYRNIGIKV